MGDAVRIQNVFNQAGRHPTRWDKTGTVVEVLQYHQYGIRTDGSGRLTTRNRRFLRWYTPHTTDDLSSPPFYPSPAPTPPERRSSETTPDPLSHEIHVEPTADPIPPTTPVALPASTPVALPVSTPHTSPVPAVPDPPASSPTRTYASVARPTVTAPTTPTPARPAIPRAIISHKPRRIHQAAPTTQQARTQTGGQIRPDFQDNLSGH